MVEEWTTKKYDIVKWDTAAVELVKIPHLKPRCGLVGIQEVGIGGNWYITMLEERPTGRATFQVESIYHAAAVELQRIPSLH